jgi:hypothetical protein
MKAKFNTMANFFTTNKLFSVVLVILLATKLVNSDKTVSFTISNFSGSKSIITLEEDAKISADGVLELNNPEESDVFVGRAFYTSPVPIWDPSTGNVASFITTFSFILQDFGNTQPADGLVFFLAPPDATIPSTSVGGWLGVIDGKNAFNQFVGVEFDNFINEWDPDYSHIGIDVNSLISLKTTPWKRVNEVLVEVSIAYDSNSKILSVVLSDDLQQLSTVAQVVDFKDVLPETVKIGFSASNSAGQRHNIHSWAFSSILKTATSSTNSNNITSYVA